MENTYRLHVIPIEEPTQYSFPQDLQDTPICDYISINFCYTHVVRPFHPTNSDMPTTTTSFNQHFWIPCNLFSYAEFADTSIFYDTFSSLPIPLDVMDSVLPHIVDCATDMMAHNFEGRHMLEMDVNLRVTTRPRIEEHEYHANTQDADADADIDNLHTNASLALETLANSLERVRIDDHADADAATAIAASCSSERCAICLEEFCQESESSSEKNNVIVRTQCSHVFHQDCIVRWFQYCSTGQSCPLCRHQIVC